MPQIRKCILGCPNNNGQMFRIPTDFRREQWFATLKIPLHYAKYTHLCNRHFSRQMYADNKIKRNALPDMNLQRYTEPIVMDPTIASSFVEQEEFNFDDIISVDSNFLSDCENDISTDLVCSNYYLGETIETTPAITTTTHRNMSLPRQSIPRTGATRTHTAKHSNTSKQNPHEIIWELGLPDNTTTNCNNPEVYDITTVKPSISSIDYASDLADAIIHLKQQFDRKLQRNSTIKFDTQNSITDIIRDEILKLPDDIQERVHEIMKKKTNPTNCSDDLKALSLAVFFLSPIAYRFLKEYFNWPDEKMLQAFISEWPTKPGLNTGALNKLQFRSHSITLNCSQLTRQTTLHYHKRKNRIVGIDNDEEMTAKTTVMTLSITAISFEGKSWQQPLAYYVLRDSVTKLKMIKLEIFNAIRKLQEIHFHPKKLLCDRTEDFESFAKTIGIMEDSGYFIVNEKKVMFEYDTT